MRFRAFPAIAVSALCCLLLAARDLVAADANDGPAGVSRDTGRAAPQPGKHYDQWTEAKRGTTATPPTAIHAPPGFEVDLLRSALPDEGSWISLAFDPQGRLLISKEGTSQGTLRGILRLTPPKPGSGEGQCELIDDTLQECRGLVYAFDSLYARCNKTSPGRPSGLYRLRDTDGDDRYDDVKLLRAEPGGGHGINDLTLGPDNRIYLIQGDESGLPADWQPADSRVQHCGYDQLFDELGGERPKQFERPPPGYLVRTDADGKSWELLAAGLRNPYGIDFNRDGELFTYEADYEWHIGLPFYRPTHLIHLVSGVDFGWRSGSRPWPFYYPERPPESLTIGLGSPTAVKFGTGSNFPPRYRESLFVLDWAYGRILAIRLTPAGASYQCRQEDFLDGRPLNVTDLEFGPDGAMYFITGGRQTQSGLYRVRYVGPKNDPPPLTPAEQSEIAQAAAARQLRHKLEALHGHRDPSAIGIAWPHLDSSDPWIRVAARIAVESQPLAEWQERAIAEQQPTAALTAMLALARTGGSGLKARFVARLAAIDWEPLDEARRLMLLRCYELALIRWGVLSPGESARLAARLSEFYPTASVKLNRELGELLVFLHAPDVVPKTVPLAAHAKEQSEQLLFLEVLRNATEGWTRESTQLYFETLARAQAAQGGHLYPQYLASIQTAALSRLSAAERLLAAQILEHDAPANVPAPPPRAFVKAWTMADLEASLDTGGTRDLGRGESLFAAAQCSHCHRMGSQGRLIGPDLTSLARRFSRKDMLRSIIEPSAVIDEKYQLTIITTESGRTVTGIPLEESARTLVLLPNALSPETVTLEKSQFAGRRLSTTSPMPQGLANTLTLEEILNLLAYLESGGK